MIADAAAVFDYDAQPKEGVFACNLCGSSKNLRTPWEVARQKGLDRYGYPVVVAECLECGLVFLAARMTAEAYRRFYESGAYRRLVSAYHGREINAETIQDEQREYGRSLAAFLAPHLDRWAPYCRYSGGTASPDLLGTASVLDVGGSTGVVARTLNLLLGLTPAVLDPAAAELACAEGLERIPSTAEDFDPQGRTWDLITLCQTIDHLLDPMAVLKKLRACLSERGLLFVDIVDYDVTRTIKIDHPYNFTVETMGRYLDKAGFRQVLRERAPDGVHVRFLCERSR